MVFHRELLVRLHYMDKKLLDAIIEFPVEETKSVEQSVKVLEKLMDDEKFVEENEGQVKMLSCNKPINSPPLCPCGQIFETPYELGVHLAIIHGASYSAHLLAGFLWSDSNETEFCNLFLKDLDVLLSILYAQKKKIQIKDEKVEELKKKDEEEKEEKKKEKDEAEVKKSEDQSLVVPIYDVESQIIARWTEDNIWYNAVVQAIDETNGNVDVIFTDYGNVATVPSSNIILSAGEVPDDQLDMIDECVIISSNDPDFVTGASVLATILEEEDCVSTLETSKDDDIDECVGLDGDDAYESSVPSSLQCSLCGGLCRRGIRLVCCNFPTCWDCAAKETKSTRICWKCGEKGFTILTHLVEDNMLKFFVEHFVETGILGPINLHPEHLHPALKKMLLSQEKEQQVVDSVVDVEEVLPGSERGNFTDDANSDVVKNASILANPDSIPHGTEVDPHVELQLRAESVVSVEFLKMMKNVNSDGVGDLETKQIMSLQDLRGPVGLSIMADKTLAVVCKGDNTVKRFSMEGEFCGLVSGPRQFVKPTDILVLKSGEFVIRDEIGIQMFGEQGNFLRQLGKESINKYYGLAEDECGRVVTINSNTGMGRGKLTEVGETDLFYIDTTTGGVVKRVELIDIVGEKKSNSACRFLSFSNKKLFIADIGLDCVYVLVQKDGEEKATVFGSSGSSDGQFRQVAGLAVDTADTIIVVDSKNDRLQLVDKDYTFRGVVKVIITNLSCEVMDHCLFFRSSLLSSDPLASSGAHKTGLFS